MKSCCQEIPGHPLTCALSKVMFHPSTTLGITGPTFAFQNLGQDTALTAGFVRAGRQWSSWVQPANFRSHYHQVHSRPQRKNVQAGEEMSSYICLVIWKCLMQWKQKKTLQENVPNYTQKIENDWAYGTDVKVCLAKSWAWLDPDTTYGPSSHNRSDPWAQR